MTGDRSRIVKSLPKFLKENKFYTLKLHRQFINK